MDPRQIVLDTNVLVAGLRSSQGAAYRLLSLVGTERFGINLSVPLVLEYEDVLLRRSAGVPLTAEAVGDVLDYFCSVARHQKIFFLWRPYLVDPGDDMLLELAVKGSCGFIVTFNRRHFAGCERFGVEAITPAAFLRTIGELP
jgi:predicted nucleic acid-binding protein